MIFYFSGTGNSKWIANQLSKEQKEELVFIPDALKNRTFEFCLREDEKIGFVFPIYSWAPPEIVLNFIRQLSLKGYKRQYLFFVCSCGDDTGLTQQVLEKALSHKGWKCHAGFSVTMPNNYVLLPGFDVDKKELEEKKLADAITTLDREMMPLIRYRTRDLTRILPGKCPCGRTHIRIDRIKGRSDDMFIIKGVNIFPMQVEKILVQFPELGSNYLITLETVNNQDEMIVEVELSDLSTDNYIELEKIRKDITRQLKDEILVTPKVKLVKKGSLPQSEGKAVRVKDLRDNK